MWKPKSVELALFLWPKWRQSIVSEWATPHEVKSDVFLTKAKEETMKLGFPPCLLLEIYWACCVVSEYALDYPITYDNILVPEWLPIPAEQPESSPVLYYFKHIAKYDLKPGIRIYPPHIMKESEIDFVIYEDGYQLPFPKDLYYPKEGDYVMLIPQDHELNSILNQIKGRPKLFKKPGMVPSYSDRLAVKCAVLRSVNMTITNIAQQLNLSKTIKRPYLSEQSDTVRHLIERGRRLIQEMT
jgi:hypothetical protein